MKNESYSLAVVLKRNIWKQKGIEKTNLTWRQWWAHNQHNLPRCRVVEHLDLQRKTVQIKPFHVRNIFGPFSTNQRRLKSRDNSGEFAIVVLLILILKLILKFIESKLVPATVFSLHNSQSNNYNQEYLRHDCRPQNLCYR